VVRFYVTGRFVPVVSWFSRCEKMWKVRVESVEQVDGKGGDSALNRNGLTHNNEKHIDAV
jgi:hypothetical protein